MSARWHLATFDLLNGAILVALSMLSALRRSQETISMDNDFYLSSSESSFSLCDTDD